MIVVNFYLRDNTLRRFNTLLNDLMEKRRKNMDTDDLLNELIDNYEQNNWDQFMVSGG